MIIKIYKTNNCRNCEILFDNLKQAINKLKRNDISIIEEKSLISISKKGIAYIPALEIDGNIISEGVVYSVEDIVKIINNEQDDYIVKKIKGADGSCSVNGKK